MSVYTTVFAGSTPIGGLLAGAIASAFGVPISIAFGGAGSLVVGLAAYAWYRRHRAAAVTRPSIATAARPVNPSGRVDTGVEGAPEAARPSSAPG